MKREELYKKINTPEELLEFMNKNIEYGIYGTDNKIYTPGTEEENNQFQYACVNLYELSDSKKLLKCGYGHCWDQVELERDWFSKQGYEFKTFYIMFVLDYDNSYATHTYLIYRKENKYYYFENADYKNRGIYEFNSYEEAIRYQREKHIEYNKEIGNKIDEEILKSLKIYEYKKPKPGLTMQEFINYVLSSKEVKI